MEPKTKNSEVKCEVKNFNSNQKEICSKDIKEVELPTLFYFNAGDNCELSYECCRMC